MGFSELTKYTMPNWKTIPASAAGSIEAGFDSLKRRLDDRGDAPLHIAAYRSFGTHTRLALSGRVLAEPGLRGLARRLGLAQPGEYGPPLRKRRGARRAGAGPASGSLSQVATTDAEGLFHGRARASRAAAGRPALARG